ncbi:MAG: L7Ae/L30e/S12e/Gadd45 family ribosomal protein [Oscillospiraceae bacterium]
MSCITFLGLSQKAGYLEIGEESCGIAARARKAKVLLTASDASRNSLVRAKNYSEDAKAPHVVLPFTKDELGAVVGRGLPGMLAITDTGMAAAFVQKLSAEYPGKFDEQAETLRISAERAMQRKKEAQRHKENLRHGKKKS